MYTEQIGCIMDLEISNFLSEIGNDFWNSFGWRSDPPIMLVYVQVQDFVTCLQPESNIVSFHRPFSP